MNWSQASASRGGDPGAAANLLAAMVGWDMAGDQPGTAGLDAIANADQQRRFGVHISWVLKRTNPYARPASFLAAPSFNKRSLRVSVWRCHSWRRLHNRFRCRWRMARSLSWRPALRARTYNSPLRSKSLTVTWSHTAIHGLSAIPAKAVSNCAVR
jgi:hypothetical protein